MTTTTKTIIAAAAFAVASSLMAAKPSTAEAMPGINIDTTAIQAGIVVKAGWKRRALRRALRRHVWNHRRGAYYNRGWCHAHWVKVPGKPAYRIVHCGHRPHARYY